MVDGGRPNAYIINPATLMLALSSKPAHKSGAPNKNRISN